VSEEELFEGLEEPLKAACMVKNKEIVQEAMSEYSRRGNFVRIYPSKNSYMYD
jgi:hypothetical protein